MEGYFIVTNDNSMNEMNKQIKNAFEFMQKLYNESSYLIKEIEGLLAECEFRFQILKTSGYSISTRSSTGLEPNNVNLWLLRKFAVAFVEDSNTELIKGQNKTAITNNLKVLYFRIILDENNLSEPNLLFGVLYDIEKCKDWIKKFENILGHIEYNDMKIFSTLPIFNYQDSTIKMKGELYSINLLDIKSSDELHEKVIEPVLELYKRKILENDI